MKIIRNTLLIAAVTISGSAFSQVVIGDNTGTAAVKTSVLLEFANTNNKGIVLPYVRTKATAPTEGSIILDVSNPADARVKYYNANSAAGTAGWTDLSGQGADVSAILSSQPTEAQVVEPAEAKSIIGAESSAVNDGVLVLESKTKAMVLPTVADVADVPSPSPGMMVFVNKAGAKRLAVYNGSVWSFWRP